MTFIGEIAGDREDPGVIGSITAQSTRKGRRVCVVEFYRESSTKIIE
jgi:hypothetical protein